MSDRLSNKTALVTGATSNIGRAIAVALAAEGAQVAVAGRNRERGEDVVAEIRAAGGRAEFLAADLDGSPAASRALAGDALRILGGRVDILVNNAGIYPSPTTADTDEETFDRIYSVNVKAPFFLTAALAPAMVRAGGGAVVNLGSWIARLAVPVGPVYSASKAAMESLTRSWAAEYGAHGVRVNAVSPGVVHTPTPDGDPAHAGDVMMRGTPAGDHGLPESIAQAVVYLASDDADFVHGAVLDVDGGRTAVAVIAG